MADHFRADLEVDQPELDHRDLNIDLGVFATDPLVGTGLPLWLPAGAVIRQELEALAGQIAARDGCQPVYSPVLGKRALFERSGTGQVPRRHVPADAGRRGRTGAAPGELPPPRDDLRL